MIILPVRAASPAGPRKTGELSKEVATGCGLMKGEADPPLKADAEYPAWLWKLLEPAPSGNELEKAYKEGGLSMEEVSEAGRGVD